MVVWQGGDPLGPSVGTGGAFDAWFGKARSSPGRLWAFDGSAAGMVAAAGAGDIPLYVGLIADLAPQAVDGFAEALNDIAVVAAQQLYRLRRDGEIRRRRARLDGSEETQAELLAANADILWQTDEAGNIHVVRVLNGRHDLVRRIEGRNLQNVRIAGEDSLAALVRAGGRLRNLRLEQDGEEALYISVRPATQRRGPRGTLCAGAGPAADRPAVSARLIESMLDARSREELSRREAESMLLGLRILLAATPFRGKLEQLARLLASTAGCDVVQIVQLRPAEAPRLLSPHGLLSSRAADALARLLAMAEGRGVTVLPAAEEDCTVIRTILAAEDGDIAIVTLPYAAERFYLVCRGRPTFGSRQQGIAERFSLLLQQALALRNDQERLVHTAKLSMLGQMSVAVAHELRQPLNTISVAVQNLSMLAERAVLTPMLLEEKAGRILKQVERACRVMDRMRRFGRKSGCDFKPVPLLAMARSARSLTQAVAERGGMVIDIDIPDGMEVLADELEIEQVLVNLIQNAHDAMTGGDLPARMRIWSEPDPDRDLVRLHVQDNGPGFCPRTLRHALDAFFTTKAGDKGTGLGLSIAHAILREHGGQLHIANAAGGGALVTLVLRRAGDARVVSIAPRSGKP
jgi:signal transduction histidine kinase